MKNNSADKKLTNKILGILEMDRSVIELLLDDIRIESLKFKKDEHNIIHLTLTIKDNNNTNVNVIGTYSQSFLFANIGTVPIYESIIKYQVVPALEKHGAVI